MKITREEYNQLNKELANTKNQLKYTTEAAIVLDHFINHYNEYRVLADELSQTRTRSNKGVNTAP